MTDTAPTSAHDFVVQQLDERLESIERDFAADALCMVGPLVSRVDDMIRIMVEALRKRNDGPGKDRLVVLVTTNGGYIEIVHRVVDTFRRHYRHVSFVIPNHAFSAGTVLAMSGDEIWMDYYSRLGPIDPQVENARTGRQVPANGYLTQWRRLLAKAKRGTLTDVEAAMMIQGFDQAELYSYEQAGKLSVALLKEWLVKYKFKDWTETRTRKMPVTEAMRQKRAVEIAKKLGNTDRWHSHGYGISKVELERDIDLIIDDLDKNQGRCDLVRQYDLLLSDYMTRLRVTGILHVVGDFLPTFVAD